MYKNRAKIKRKTRSKSFYILDLVLIWFYVLALDLVLRFILALFLYIEHFLQVRKMQVLSKSAIVCIQLFHSYTKQYCTRPALLN